MVVLWSSAFVYLGFYAGEFLTKAGVNIEVAAILIIFLSVSPMAIHALGWPNIRTDKEQLSVLLSQKCVVNVVSFQIFAGER